MPVYILIRAIDGWNPDDPMVYMTGYPVDVRSHSRIGGKQVPPNFVQVEITDEDDPALIQNIYCREWRREIDWEFIGHDYVIDGHRLRVFVKPEYVSVSGLNSLTREMVENYLTRWGASVVSVAANSVTFDAVIIDAIKSEGFWSRDVSQIVFNEDIGKYNETTGLHNVEVDYTALASVPNIGTIVRNYITQRGGTITKEIPNKTTFEITRINVFDMFKLDVKEKVDNYFSRRMFKLLPAHVEMALNNGGTLSVTKQQFATYIYNRLND